MVLGIRECELGRGWVITYLKFQSSVKCRLSAFYCTSRRLISMWTVPFTCPFLLSGGSFCRIVTQGYSFVNATHLPRACPAGSYTDVDGAQNCSLCPHGYTSNDSPSPGADGCEACPAGQYANIEGAPTCSEVPKGYASNRTVR